MQEIQWIVYAVNVHTGGGKVLLDSVLSGREIGPVYALFADQRYKAKASSDLKIFYSKNSLFERLKAEFKLHRFIQSLPKGQSFRILFFGNLPPIMKPQVSSVLFLQNCYLTRQVPLPSDSPFEKMRNLFESLLLKWFSGNVNVIWVQTAWMERMARLFLPRSQLQIKPILPEFVELNSNLGPRVFDFIYVGSLSVNKRLGLFVDAVSRLSLKLTHKVKVAIVLDSQEVDLKIKELKNVELDVSFKIPHPALLEKLARSKAFVATSAYESFCLPVYEAKFYGCSVIAPIAGYTEDLDFEFTKYQLDDAQDLAEKMFSLL